MSIPNLEELYAFKKCVRKFSRVKLRTIENYNLLNKINSNEDDID